MTHKCSHRFSLRIISDGLESARAYGSWELADVYLEALKELVAGRPAFGERRVAEELEARRERIPPLNHETATERGE